jgi:hypothetical protein
VIVRKLLPDPVPGMEIDRMELPPGSRMTGIPHTPGTREYLMCETGQIALTAAGEHWLLDAGDVVAFRGDQKHAYANPPIALRSGPWSPSPGSTDASIALDSRPAVADLSPFLRREPVRHLDRLVVLC